MDKELARNQNLKDEADYQDLKVEKNVRKDLDKYYRDYASLVLQKYKKRAMGNIAGKKVLDLGCGIGAATIEALKAGAKVTSIDISPKSIEHVIEEAKKIGLSDNLEAMVMDAQNLTFESETFDLVMGSGILHHLPDLEASLKCVRRVLKRGRYAVFSEPLGMNPALNLYRAMTPSMRTKDEQPFRMKEINTVRKVFPKAKFEFFDFTTLFSKFLMAARLNGGAKKMEKKLIRLDDRLIRNKKRKKITLFKKWSWNVVIVMKK